MTYKVDGIYKTNDYGDWESKELFVKHGEVRMIDGKLHALRFSICFFRVWREVYPSEIPYPIVRRVKK